MVQNNKKLALFLSGGGARAAYQVGLLGWLGRNFPDLTIPILTGISAGAINAAYLANHVGRFDAKAVRLAELWAQLSAEDVFRVDSLSIARKVLSWSSRLLMGGGHVLPTDSLVDAKPLESLLTRTLEPQKGVLTGITKNIRRGDLEAIAVTASNYSTGQSITWVQGRDVRIWDRVHRKSVRCRLHLGHILASASLPIFFPAVYVHGDWYGDGGIRMSAPLAPAIHLGAERLIVVTTHYESSVTRNRAGSGSEPPPPVQVAGALFNAIFLDVLDNDIQRLERFNRLVPKLLPDQRDGLREVDLLVMRPSRDMGEIVSQYESRLPNAFRFMTRGLGTQETRSNDILSFITFEKEYINELIKLGEHDAEQNRAAFEQFLRPV